MNALTKAMIKPALGMIKPEMIKQQIKDNADPVLKRLDEFIASKITLEQGKEQDAAMLLKRNTDKQGRPTVFAYPVTMDYDGAIVRVLPPSDIRDILENLDVEGYLEQLKNSL